MKNGDYVNARTHYEFLNEAFGTSYTGWMSCVWNYSDDTIVWMARFDSENRTGWGNRFSFDKTTFIESNFEKKTIWNGKPLSDALAKKRLVFEIIENGSFRKYLFRGVFVFDEQKSTDKEHL